MTEQHPEPDQDPDATEPSNPATEDDQDDGNRDDQDESDGE